MKYVLLKSSEKKRIIAKSCFLDFASRLLKVNSIVPGKACEQPGAEFTWVNEYWPLLCIPARPALVSP